MRPWRPGSRPTPTAARSADPVAPAGWAQRLAGLVGLRARLPAPASTEWPPRRSPGRRGEGFGAVGLPVPYPGDFPGMPDLSYAPHRDGQPDPGEIVWAWVPYEEDHAQGKDR